MRPRDVCRLLLDTQESAGDCQWLSVEQEDGMIDHGLANDAAMLAEALSGALA